MAKQYYWLLRHVGTGKIIRAGALSRDIAEFMGISSSLVVQRSNTQTLHQGHGFDGCRIDKIDRGSPTKEVTTQRMILGECGSPCERCKRSTVCGFTRGCDAFQFWVRLKWRTLQPVFGRRPQ